MVDLRSRVPPYHARRVRRKASCENCFLLGGCADEENHFKGVPTAVASMPTFPVPASPLVIVGYGDCLDNTLVWFTMPGLAFPNRRSQFHDGSPLASKP